jgi:DNA-binding SARP family transcriptional activator
MQGTFTMATQTAADTAALHAGSLRTPAVLAGWAGAELPVPTLALRSAARQAPALTVKMLDGFRVWQGTEALPALPQGRVRALLKLLLLQRRRPISRARLAALFWPEADSESARNNLHVALHRLRRTLGSAARLHLGGEGYQLLTSGEAWLDTEQFVQHAEAGLQQEGEGHIPEAIAQYEAAVSLYHRDLLEEGEWEASLAADAQALRDRLSQVLERLLSLREQRAEWHACLQHALRQLEIDACNESVHRRMMRCYASLGQMQLAERQYRRCVHVLREQFGIGPSEETTALYRRIASRVAA